MHKSSGGIKKFGCGDREQKYSEARITRWGAKGNPGLEGSRQEEGSAAWTQVPLR